MVLTKGPTVTGRVVDGADRPIKGARIVLGRDTFGPNSPTGTTNERGEFTLVNCDHGPSILTVQADGLAPRIQEVRIEERTAPVEFRLTEPGSVLRVRVVDVRGQPVAGATFGPDTWRGHRSIHFRGETGPDGRLEWKSAPKDVVLYGIWKSGYMTGLAVPLTATGREQVVTLYPELIISGRVTHTETGRPLPNCRLFQGWRVEGRQETNWALNMAVDISKALA
jgi:hypothetical protein